VIESLLHHGARVSYHDPHIHQVALPAGGMLECVTLTDEALATADCVLIHTAHSDYDWERIAARAPLIFDTRNAINAVERNETAELYRL
jgi:UDP-N-acetyl-D-glucosamine dehydrogenase